ncbi:Scavenger receptor cysteine-rich domain superfamily protein, partial [Geodia barretti]
LSGLWGSVCNYLWDARHAQVVCRQLGYDGPSFPLHHTTTLTVSPAYHLDNVDCRGNEIMLSDCKHRGIGLHDCSPGQEAGVTCNNRECTENDVRLVSGRTGDDGQVEMCLNGAWTPVCSDRWGYRPSNVVCRQLGYNGPSYPRVRQRAKLQNYLVTVNCIGNEARLSGCSHRKVSVCYGGTAGVICNNGTCDEGTVHLVGSDDVSRGRAIYCHNGTWHSLCRDHWNSTGEEARVLCQTLGYDTSRYALALVDYGRGTSPVIQCGSGQNALSDCSKLDDSQCRDVTGVDCIAPCTTQGLTDCQQDNVENYYGFWGFEFYYCNCSSDCISDGSCCSDISVTKNCFGKLYVTLRGVNGSKIMSKGAEKECKNGKVRLVGGVTNSTGRLEFCANGVWGRVCNELEYWGPDNARVVCRQLGFSEKGAYILDYEDRFGTSNRSAVIGEVYCNGTEPELLECFHASIGTHRCYRGSIDTDIIISCYDENRGCENGEVRLQGGAGSSNGHVEFCKDRVWGRVCRRGWDMNDTMVVCRQLGFDPEDSADIPGPANAGDVPVFLGQVNCSGSEQYFNECSHGRPPTGGCARAAISCKTSSNETKCAAQAETSTYPASYGECSVYKSETGVCDDVVRPGIDYVYASYRLGDQSTIAQLLNKNIKDIDTDQNEYCMKQSAQSSLSFLPPSLWQLHPSGPSLLHLPGTMSDGTGDMSHNMEHSSLGIRFCRPCNRM